MRRHCGRYIRLGAQRWGCPLPGGSGWERSSFASGVGETIIRAAFLQIPNTLHMVWYNETQCLKRSANALRVFDCETRHNPKAVLHCRGVV